MTNTDTINYVSQILVVEDELTLQDVYKLILQSHGHDVLLASNGVEALNSLKTTQPNLILLDINMPKMNGVEFMKHFVALELPITVVVLSNMSSSDEVDEALELGAADSVTKAKTGPAELLGIVNKYTTTGE